MKWAALGAAVLTLHSVQAATGGAELLQAHCASCHLQEDGSLSRIDAQRKSPEAWQMTINRMRAAHGVSLAREDMSEGEVLGAMVKHLADTRGLAPAETTGLRYILERNGNTIEAFPQEMTEMCGRCHSSARVALQRRTPEEWNRIIDQHLGQWPSTEYSLYGRDREWLKIARNDIIPQLSASYPLQTAEWDDWQAAEKNAPDGSWAMSGHVPGEGDFSAVMSVTPSPDRPDNYRVEIRGHYADGGAMYASGTALLYTGFEWRSRLKIGEEVFNQSFALAPDGLSLSGRMYQRDQELVGAPVTAIKDTGRPAILSVYPKGVAINTTSEVVVTGLNLEPEKFNVEGATTTVAASSGPTRAVLAVTPNGGAGTGYRDLSMGDASLDAALAVYAKVDALEVVPGYGIARIGGNGGGTPKVETVFRARGVDHGADGAPGTEDDLDLGYIDSVTWRTVPRDEGAANDRDVEFAGKMDANTGRFVPAAAGPNPARARSTNNAGNLNVVARYEKDEHVVEATGRLLVTVQTWVNPPMK